MPNINIADKRKRDAVVKAESVRIDEPVRYLGPKGGQTYTRRILKSTTEHDYDALADEFGDAESISQALINGDPEVDLER